MKICAGCKESKDLEEFYRSSSNKDGRQGKCKRCHSERYREKYTSDPQYMAYKKASSQKNIDLRLEYVWNYLKTHPCVDCGNTDIRVLEFDHLRDKTMGVSRAIRYSLDKVKQEIEKCEVRCANCHRIKTYKQLGWKVPSWVEGENNEQGTKEHQYKEDSTNCSGGHSSGAQ